MPGQAAVPYDVLVKDIARRYGSLVPVRKPTDIEDVRLFRIFLHVVRQAEVDLLSRQTAPETKAEAARTLFGLHNSPLVPICRILGIDPAAAKLKIIEWEVKHKTGDPVFGYMVKPSVVDKFERGDELDMPRFRSGRCKALTG